MKKVVFDIPLLRADESGYRALFKLTSEVREDPNCSFDFNFKHCSRLDFSAVAVLGMLAKHVSWQNDAGTNLLKGLVFKSAGVMFLVDTMSDVIRGQLVENNFLSHFSRSGFSGYPHGGYIGYREHGKLLDPNEIASHLYNEWLTDEKISVADDLKKAIVSRIFEIFMNAYGHGSIKSSYIGAVSCGHYDRKEKKLHLCVIDFGLGVCETVKNYLGSDISDIDALNWALKMGNSTKTDSNGLDIPRGLGFGLLKEFVAINSGSIKVYTNNCRALLDQRNEYIVTDGGYGFAGTLVEITINCDDRRHYKFVKQDLDDAKQYF